MRSLLICYQFRNATSMTVFVKPTVLEPPLACVDKGKTVIVREVLATVKATTKSPTKRSPTHAIIVA